MTAPNTNVEKQTRRHKGSLGGIALAIALAIIVIAGLFFWSTPEATTDATDTVETINPDAVETTTIDTEGAVADQ